MKVEFLAKFNQDLNRIHLTSVKKSLAILMKLLKRQSLLGKFPTLKSFKGLNQPIVFVLEIIGSVCL